MMESIVDLRVELWLRIQVVRSTLSLEATGDTNENEGELCTLWSASRCHVMNEIWGHQEAVKHENSPLSRDFYPPTKTVESEIRETTRIIAGNSNCV